MPASWRDPLLRKPLSIAVDSDEKLVRRLSLVDLLSIGVGGTIGSGVFVLAGAIANDANNPAGPSTALSFLIAGVGCVFSGLSFAELSSRIPAAGSTYAYAYVSLGEIFAFIAGCCLTLEYGISSSAVARSWGEKLTTWAKYLDSARSGANLEPGRANGINVYAGGLVVVCTLTMLRGVNLSKLTVDFFTLAKLVLVLFLVIGGFVLRDSANYVPFVPSGVTGIFRGALHCFFGYLGYDEVCCLGGEAKDPTRNIPLAVLLVIGAVTCIYCLAALSLTGMLPYTAISRSSGFSEAFRERQIGWAADTIAIGELITLPLVVFVSLMAQPRLQYAMANDGLLPAIFARLDANGNLVHGTLICGLCCSAVAMLLPFEVLDDMISAGVLVAFNLTNSGLIVLRRAHPARSEQVRWLVLLLNILALAAAFSWTHLPFQLKQLPLQLGFSLAAMLSVAFLSYTCPEQTVDGSHYFRVPLVPWLPAVGIAFNYMLLAQLTWQGLWQISVFLAAAISAYFLYGYQHSLGHIDGWRDLIASSKRRRQSLPSGESCATDSELVPQLPLDKSCPVEGRASRGNAEQAECEMARRSSSTVSLEGRLSSIHRRSSSR